jgi:hypothetical protein
VLGGENLNFPKEPQKNGCELVGGFEQPHVRAGWRASRGADSDSGAAEATAAGLI